MNDERLANVVEQLIRHWRQAPCGSGAAQQSYYQMLAQRVANVLPAQLAAQVEAAPEEHRKTIELALERLEERDPATRDLLRPLAPAQPDQFGASGTPTAASFSELAPAADAAFLGKHPPNIFNQGSGGVQVGYMSGFIGSGNSIGAGSAVGAGARGGSGNITGSGNVAEVTTLGAGATFESGSHVAISGLGPAEPASPFAPSPGLLLTTAEAAATSITILFVGANPIDGARLRLDKEVREIDSVLRQGSLRDRFEFKQHWAVRMLDLQQALLLHRPQILHFSGHGSSAHAIYLETDSGQSLPIAGALLARLLALFSSHLRCVVLNACYSEDQALAVARHIECVVGMTTAVADAAAIHFAAAFYQALAFGSDVQTAFDLGCVHVQPTSPGQENTPRLIALRRKPSEIILSAGS